MYLTLISWLEILLLKLTTLTTLVACASKQVVRFHHGGESEALRRRSRAFAIPFGVAVALKKCEHGLSSTLD
jgi:hypothetical protein